MNKSSDGVMILIICTPSNDCSNFHKIIFDCLSADTIFDC